MGAGRGEGERSRRLDDGGDGRGRGNGRILYPGSEAEEEEKEAREDGHAQDLVAKRYHGAPRRKNRGENHGQGKSSEEEEATKDHHPIGAIVPRVRIRESGTAIEDGIQRTVAARFSLQVRQNGVPPSVLAEDLGGVIGARLARVARVFLCL